LGASESDDYLRAHAELPARDRWIIDGFGCLTSVWERFASADTLVSVDLPLFTHFLLITKRLIQGHFVTPEGWPEGSPMLGSTISSYRVLRLCHRQLTPRYRDLVFQAAASKRGHHLRPASQIAAFLKEVQLEARSA
jgi:hypothetical protein